MDDETDRQLALAEDNDEQPMQVIPREVSQETNLMRLQFAKEYIVCRGNGTEAARRAGYGGTRASLSRTASKLLKGHDVQQYLTAHLRSVMDAREVVARLAQVARGSIADFAVIDPVTGHFTGFDFSTPQARESMGLIKKVKQGAHGFEMEMYSKLGALELLIRCLQMEDAQRARQEVLAEAIDAMPESVKEPFKQLLANFSDPVDLPGGATYSDPDEPPDTYEEPEIERGLPPSIEGNTYRAVSKQRKFRKGTSRTDGRGL